MLGSFISRLRERLGNAATFKERASLADAALLERLVAHLGSLDPQGDPITRAVRFVQQRRGSVSVATLAGLCGLSERQFSRRFRSQVGVPPSLYGRIVRFERALDRKARCPALPWTDVAQEFGYFDQMHMIHDFAEFTGYTPASLLPIMGQLFSGSAAGSAGPPRSAAGRALVL